MAFLEDFGALTRKGNDWAYTGTERRGYSMLPGAARATSSQSSSSG